MKQKYYITYNIKTPFGNVTYVLSICMLTAVDSLGFHVLICWDCSPALVLGLADLDQMD